MSHSKSKISLLHTPYTSSPYKKFRHENKLYLFRPKSGDPADRRLFMVREEWVEVSMSQNVELMLNHQFGSK